MVSIPSLPSPFKNEAYITFGIDAGLRYTGISWFADGTFESIQANNVCQEFSLVPLEGAEVIISAVKGIAKGKKILLVVEDFAFGGTFNVQQGELIGALKYMVKSDEQFIGAVFLAPNTAKKIVTGNGRASKGSVKKSMVSLTQRRLPTSHVADAIAILYSYQQIYSEPTASMYRRAMVKN